MTYEKTFQVKAKATVWK